MKCFVFGCRWFEDKPLFDIFKNHNIIFACLKSENVWKCAGIRAGDIIAVKEGSRIISLSKALSDSLQINTLNISFTKEEKYILCKTNRELTDLVRGVRVNTFYTLDSKDTNNIFNLIYDPVSRFSEISDEETKTYIVNCYKECSGELTLDMTENDEEENFMTDILKQKKQIILQGAPGTGKTYKTAEIAVSLIDGNVPSDRSKLMERYKELVKAERIFFTTFHQSMDYEEFVEGYKPTDEGSGFKRKNGIFLKACNAAVTQTVSMRTIDKEESLNNKSLKNALNEFAYDLSNNIEDRGFMIGIEPNTIILKTKSKEKEFYVGVDCSTDEIELRIMSLDGTQKWGTFPLDEYYENINSKAWFRTYAYPILEFLYENYNLIKYDELNQLQESDNLKKTLPPVILIIDEINRANISIVFGELITLLEADKRAGAINAISCELPYSGDKFAVPPNLYIIGTMNTADRTIGYIDYALRRRFAFITIEAEREKCSPIALPLFDSVKKIIEENISSEFEASDLMIGHSYFIVNNEDELNIKLEYEIKPLLLEYLKDGILLDKNSSLKETIKNLTV